MQEKKDIKCIVWDLDGTLWEGILLESDGVKLKPGVKEVIQALDSRGILHSIASKNDYHDAMEKLRTFGLHEYFLYPEITWNAKSRSIKKIQENLNVSLDSLMFIDDQPFERDEVKLAHPEVTCVDASEYMNFLYYPRLNPRFVTEDSRRRRLTYIEGMRRKRDEDEYKGPRKEFLASLDMQFIISKAKEEDLRRAEELTIRTNQLNATGMTFSYDDLKMLLSSDRHELLICELNDKYGAHGKIGLALIEKFKENWHLRLLLMSCRVISYGVGTILLSHIMHKAKKAKKKLLADFRDTGKNRLMFITLKFANFKKLHSGDDGRIILENDLSIIQDFPSYVQIIVP